MKTAWAISSGEYSSYGVLAIFTDESSAHLMAKALNAGDGHERYEVETFPLYEDGDDLALIPCFYASADTGGDMEISVSEDGHYFPHFAPARPKLNVRTLQGGKQRITATCRDRDAAIKAVKDRLAALKATDYSSP